MRPYPEEVLRAIQTGVTTHFAPELTSSYAQAQFAFAMLLFSVVLRDYDSAAQDLVDANTALRGLISSAEAALATVAEPGLEEAGAAIAALPPPAVSMKLSALRSEHDALREAVCKLAPLIEPANDLAELAPLKGVREALYAWFAADARRRILPILPT